MHLIFIGVSITTRTHKQRKQNNNFELCVVGHCHMYKPSSCRKIDLTVRLFMKIWRHVELPFSIVECSQGIHGERISVYIRCKYNVVFNVNDKHFPLQIFSLLPSNIETWTTYHCHQKVTIEMCQQF